MISQCPHCKQSLRFSEAHQEKLNSALARLTPGKYLKFGCPKCKTPIELNKDGAPKGSETPAAKPPNETGPGQTAEKAAAAEAAITPPPVPDISWLSEAEREETEMLDDVPTAMVLIRDAGMKDAVVKSLEENQFQIYIPEGTDEAIESMRFKEYAVVAYGSDYAPGPLADQDFHKYMALMSMKKRRKMFYILIGPDFKTLYDLQALTLSANLVVNSREVAFMPRLLKKGLKDYDDLFAAYITMLKQHGKN